MSHKGRDDIRKQRNVFQSSLQRKTDSFVPGFRSPDSGIPPLREPYARHDFSKIRVRSDERSVPSSAHDGLSSPSQALNSATFQSSPDNHLPSSPSAHLESPESARLSGTDIPLSQDLSSSRTPSEFFQPLDEFSTIHLHGDNTTPSIQMKAASSREGGELDSEHISRIDASKGKGDPLPDRFQSSLEQSFGHNFANVRIHRDDEADNLNQSLNALAFTFGDDVYFRNGMYQPESSSGRHLLAHELAHVVQQGAKNESEPMRVGAASDTYEQEADAAADMVTQGSMYATESTQATSPLVQQQVGEPRIQRAGPALGAWEAVEIALTAAIVVQEQAADIHGGLAVYTDTARRRGEKPKGMAHEYSAEIFTAACSRLVGDLSATFRVHWMANDYGEIDTAYVAVDSNHTSFAAHGSSLHAHFSFVGDSGREGQDQRLWPLRWRYEGEFDPLGNGQWEFTGLFEIDAFGGFHLINPVVTDRSLISLGLGSPEVYVNKGPDIPSRQPMSQPSDQGPSQAAPQQTP